MLLGLALAMPQRALRAQDTVAERPTPAGYRSIDSVVALRGALRVPVTLRAAGIPLVRVLESLATQARTTFVADRALPALERPVTLTVTALPLRDALRLAVRGTALDVLVGPGDQLVVVTRPATRAAPRVAPLRLSGFVRNAASGEVIRHAPFVVDGVPGRRANEEGFFVLLLDEGDHRLQVRAIGFAPLDTTVALLASTTLDLVLHPRSAALTAVTVNADAPVERGDLDPLLPDMSVARLDLAVARQAPAALGEVDVLRSLTLLPGVTSASDASSAFNVRGGGVDQNLVLLDEATLYNPSHVLGFLSTFNPDAVDDVTLYKGAIPVKYGGRLSSVVDVRQREGNARRFEGGAALGLLASRAIAEGPLPRQAGSYMVAARRSYADAFLRLASDPAVRDNVAYFYDVNAKVNVRLGRHGALLLSTFLGRDRFELAALQSGVAWGNRTTTLRWNHAVARLYSKVTVTASDYDFRFDFPLAPRDSARWRAAIGNTSLKVDQTYRLTDRQALEFGGEVTDHDFQPGRVATRGRTSAVQPRAVEPRQGLSTAGYLGHEVEVGARLGLRYGLRYAAFARYGPHTRLRYANDAPVVYDPALDRYAPGRVVDSVRVGGSRAFAHHAGVEPRATVRWSLTPTSSLKASYARTQQFLQLVSNTNSPTPLDVWEPVGEWIRPQRADQVALGYMARHGSAELSAEVFGKRARNVVDFVDGADVLLNSRLETLMVQGEGRAFGLELFARQRIGRLTGWGSYTWSRAEQRFPVPPGAGAPRGGGVNDGRWYPSPHDKTHVLSLVGVWEWTAHWAVSSTFQFATGLPVTLPASRYELDGFVVAEYGPRNGARLPPYHRLDVNVMRRLARGELRLGLLNVYNRFNAQSLRVRQRAAEPLVTEAVQTSIFGIVPSLSYLLRF